MDAVIRSYPRHVQENIRTILAKVPTDAETALAMILMTATLMDLRPEDPKVAEIILDDCGAMTACG